MRIIVHVPDIGFPIDPPASAVAEASRVVDERSLIGVDAIEERVP